MVKTYRELQAYQLAMENAMDIFKITKSFPTEEKYSLVDQVRRSSRSVCANLGEAWRKRRYKAAFIAKLNDCEGEANETQVWLEIAFRCGYLDEHEMKRLDSQYDRVLGKLVRMTQDVESWIIR